MYVSLQGRNSTLLKVVGDGLLFSRYYSLFIDPAITANEESPLTKPIRGGVSEHSSDVLSCSLHRHNSANHCNISNKREQLGASKFFTNTPLDCRQSHYNNNLLNIWTKLS